MKYNILYTGIFLDKESKSNLKNWFKLKTKKNLLDNVCSDVAILSVLKKTVKEDFLSSLNIGEEVDLEVVGLLDNADIQMAICLVKSSDKNFSNNFLKIVISTNLSKVNISQYTERSFRECNGPSLRGKIGYLNHRKEIVLEMPNVYEDS